MAREMAIATFGAGCFWGVESAFAEIEGVTSTTVGYAGGTTAEPTYEDVCTGRTGHAEVLRVEYDPDVVGYERLLGVFWGIHDPTTRDRQGPDVGTQYRSVIFHHDGQQRALAEASCKREQASGRHAGEIVTEITPEAPFWRAEDYHQKFFQKRSFKRAL